MRQIRCLRRVLVRFLRLAICKVRPRSYTVHVRTFGSNRSTCAVDTVNDRVILVRYGSVLRVQDRFHLRDATILGRLPQLSVALASFAEPSRIRREVLQHSLECAKRVAQLTVVDVVQEDEVAHVCQPRLKVPNTRANDDQEQERDQSISVHWHV